MPDCRHNAVWVYYGVVVDLVLFRFFGAGAAEDFAERNEGFGAEHTERLNFLVYEVEQVLVVLRVDFDEHVVLAGCEMAFNNFRDFFEFFNHCVELVGVFEEDADEGACVVTQCGGFDECA